MEMMKSPSIVLFDCSEKVATALTADHYGCRVASLGDHFEIDYSQKKRHHIEIQYDVPPNLHEYDIMVFDMLGIDPNKKWDTCDDDKNPAHLQVRVDYPTRCFYNSPITAYLFHALGLPARRISIIFANDLINPHYECYKTSLYDNGRPVHEFHNKIECNNYAIFEHLTAAYISHESKYGSKVQLSPEAKANKCLAQILSRELNKFVYHSTFRCPYSNARMPEGSVFLPLLLNAENEVVGYLYSSKDRFAIVLPQLDDKVEIIRSLLNEYLPTIFPDKFPELTQFGWLTDTAFRLPGEQHILDEIEAQKTIHEKCMGELDAKLLANRAQYSFLHNTLTESGAPLVAATIEYMKWLDYQEVIDSDEDGSTLDEDLAIYHDDKLIIAEVKGIGGTSTDAECSQIAKHRRKYEKIHKGSKSIYVLYIVNHQRYMNPRSRANPPFTQNQIDHAISDERGLATTYQLYQWHEMIAQNILCKADVRNLLLSYGAVPMLPEDFDEIGVISEYYGGHNAFVLNLCGTPISVGDTLVFSKDYHWFSSSVRSLQLDDQDVQSADRGQVGIVVDKPMGKGYAVYIRKTSSDE